MALKMPKRCFFLLPFLPWKCLCLHFPRHFLGLTRVAGMRTFHRHNIVLVTSCFRFSFVSWDHVLVSFFIWSTTDVRRQPVHHRSMPPSTAWKCPFVPSISDLAIGMATLGPFYTCLVGGCYLIGQPVTLGTIPQVQHVSTRLPLYSAKGLVMTYHVSPHRSMTHATDASGIK